LKSFRERKVGGNDEKPGVLITNPTREEAKNPSTVYFFIGFMFGGDFLCRYHFCGFI
jgi:hypothetical protein